MTEIKTLEEAKNYKYGKTSYNGGYQYKEGFCAAEIREPGRWPSYKQCSRKNGYGPENLYCKKHAPASGEVAQIKYVLAVNEYKWEILKVEVDKIGNVMRQKYFMGNNQNLIRIYTKKIGKEIVFDDKEEAVFMAYRLLEQNLQQEIETHAAKLEKYNQTLKDTDAWQYIKKENE